MPRTQRIWQTRYWGKRDSVLQLLIYLLSNKQNNKWISKAYWWLCSCLSLWRHGQMERPWYGTTPLHVDVNARELDSLVRLLDSLKWQSPDVSVQPFGFDALFKKSHRKFCLSAKYLLTLQLNNKCCIWQPQIHMFNIKNLHHCEIISNFAVE